MSSQIVTYLNSDAVQENIKSVLGNRKNQFIASVSSLVGSNPALQNVDRKSLFSACLTAASLDLPINQNLGFAYIIPYKDKAQFQMGWKGFVQLAQRSGQFKTINATDVREGEYKGINRLTGELDIEWIEDGRETLPVVGYIAYMKLLNGFEKSFFMTKKELTQHATKFSQSFKRNSASMNMWRDDFDSMAKKTVIKLMLSKYAPLTTDMQKAQLADQAIIEETGYEYPDNEAPSPEDLSAEKERNRIIKHIQSAKTIEELQQCAEAVVTQSEDVNEMYLKKITELQEAE